VAHPVKLPTNNHQALAIPYSADLLRLLSQRASSHKVPSVDPPYLVVRWEGRLLSPDLPLSQVLKAR
jgi:hypothetical protein